MTWPEFLAQFLPQLLATVVGAGIGVYGVILAFRLQQRAATRDAVSRAADDLVERLSKFVADAEAARREQMFTNWARGDRPRVWWPHKAPISIAVERLRIATAGGERETADAISATWDRVANPEENGDQVSAVGHLATAVTSWRLGADPDEVTRALDVARSLASGDISTAPEG